MTQWGEGGRRAERNEAAGEATCCGVNAMTDANEGNWDSAIEQFEEAVAIEQDHDGPGTWLPVPELARQLRTEVDAARSAA